MQVVSIYLSGYVMCIVGTRLTLKPRKGSKIFISRKDLCTTYISTCGCGKILGFEDGRKKKTRLDGSWTTQDRHHRAANTWHMDWPPQSPGYPQHQDPLNRWVSEKKKKTGQTHRGMCSLLIGLY